MEFRNLRADEIMVRPTDTKTKGSATLLLYQDARCGMDILDESVGPERWQKEYYEVKGNVYCRVGIKTESGEWIWKSDCGIESNVDAQKGEASDAFKRAVVNFGIGRELYTAPRIKVKCPDSYYYNEHLSMQFFVKEIEYSGKTITHLVIADRFGNVVFSDNATPDAPTAVAGPAPQKSNKDLLTEFCSKAKATEPIEKLTAFYNYYQSRCATWAGTFDAAKLYGKWGSMQKS